MVLIMYFGIVRYLFDVGFDLVCWFSYSIVD